MSVQKMNSKPSTNILNIHFDVQNKKFIFSGILWKKPFYVKPAVTLNTTNFSGENRNCSHLKKYLKSHFHATL